ncbi:MAG: ATP-dependent DNA helicase RecQ [Bacteroidia bacterium]
MKTPHEVLKKYWNYDSFRPLQEEIVNSVLNGQDTIALLPTGGGKSVCFQVPGICLGKLTLVISPLIALMRDQVEQLNLRGISAGMIASSMHNDEISKILEKAIKQDILFLYVSPERLASQSFISIIHSLKIGLIAIDEAHCISQWGYDFRPSYLKISQIREILTEVPLIALTATATDTVIEDISEKLQLKNENRFRKSFLRSNLAYIVRHTQDKHGQLLRILQRINGSSVVYVRNRKRCKDISDFLIKNGISSSYYHAGLDGATRELRQKNWITNHTRVIVCTNAFGMGIDKPDVRTVIHMDMPESPEAYFQEAGRAGRDEKSAWAVLLSDPADEDEAVERFSHQWPGFDTVKAIYNWLGNFLQLPVGAGEEQSYPFQITEFVKRYKIHPVECINALKFIETQDLLSFQENTFSPSRLIVKASRDEIYDFELRKPGFEPLIKAILRSYGGAFNDFVAIRENDLAQRLSIPVSEVNKGLIKLHQLELIHYYPSNNNPRIYYTEGRHHPDRLPLSMKEWEKRKENAHVRFVAILNYLKEESVCRSAKLVEYFGERNIPPCGICDICVKNAGVNNTDNMEQKRIFDLRVILDKRVLSLDEIVSEAKGNPESLLSTLKYLIDYGSVTENKEGKFQWKMN